MGKKISETNTETLRRCAKTLRLLAAERNGDADRVADAQLAFLSAVTDEASDTAESTRQLTDAQALRHVPGLLRMVAKALESIAKAISDE